MDTFYGIPTILLYIIGIIIIICVICITLYIERKNLRLFIQQYKEKRMKPQSNYDEYGSWILGIALLVISVHSAIYPLDLVGTILITAFGIGIPILLSGISVWIGMSRSSGKKGFECAICDRESLSLEVTDISTYGNLIDGAPEKIELDNIKESLINDISVTDLSQKPKLTFNRIAIEKAQKEVKENKLVFWKQKFIGKVFSFKYNNKEFYTDTLGFLTPEGYDSLEQLCYTKPKSRFTLNKIPYLLKNTLYAIFIHLTTVIENGLPMPILISGMTKEKWDKRVLNVREFEEIAKESYDGKVTDKLLTDKKDLLDEIDKKEERYIMLLASKLSDISDKDMTNVLTGGNVPKIKNILTSKRFVLIFSIILIISILGFLAFLGSQSPLRGV